MKNLINVITLDSYGVDISLSCSKTEMLDILIECDIPYDMSRNDCCIINSKLLSMNCCFWIALHFNFEDLTTVSITPNEVPNDLKKVRLHYWEVQKKLKNILGKVNQKKSIIMEFFDPNNLYNSWTVDGVCIEHKLNNRFGMEEIISIRPIRGRRM